MLGRRILVLAAMAGMWGMGHAWADAPPAPTAYSMEARKEITQLPAAPIVPGGVDDLKLIQSRVEAVVKEALPATVAILLEDGQGSGVIVSKDGYVLTAGHVSGKPGQSVTIVLANGKELQGKSLGANNNIDSGMIKITSRPPGGKKEFPYVPMGSAKELKAGQWVVALGHPGGYREDRPPVVRLGRVLQASHLLLGTDCPLINGDSGGPLLDLDGRLIGINSRIGMMATMNIHVPIDTFEETWGRLAKGEQWGGWWGSFSRRWWSGGGGDPIPAEGVSLGIRGMDVTGQSGAVVNRVKTGTPAEKAGMHAGDIVVSLNGNKVAGVDALADQVNAHSPDDVVTITVLRDGRPVDLKVTLARGTPTSDVEANSSKTKSSVELRGVFKGGVAKGNQSTVSVREGKYQVAFGTIVGSDGHEGYVLTKASEVIGRKELKVLVGTEEEAAKVVGVSEPLDLAMLKVEGNGGNWKQVEWADLKGAKVDVGEWVATCQPAAFKKEEPAAVGVVSVGRRKIAAQSGFLGVMMGNTSDGSGAAILQVIPDSAAEKAGVKVGDVIIAVGGKAVRSGAELKEAVGGYRPGDVVIFTVRRAKSGVVEDVQATMGLGLEEQAEEPGQFSLEKLLGGAVSKRSSDFASVFQHDTVVRPVDCGGPIVDLSGKVIGINIARAGRTETYALPADIVIPMLEPLESGKLAPVNMNSSATKPHKTE